MNVRHPGPATAPNAPRVPDNQGDRCCSRKGRSSSMHGFKAPAILLRALERFSIRRG